MTTETTTLAEAEALCKEDRMKECCIECAAILCECGAYHGTDGTVAVESDRGPLYVFAQTREQEDEGDAPCALRWQYALCDAEVDRLAESCVQCQTQDELGSALADDEDEDDEVGRYYCSSCRRNAIFQRADCGEMECLACGGRDTNDSARG